MNTRARGCLFVITVGVYLLFGAIGELNAELPEEARALIADRALWVGVGAVGLAAVVWWTRRRG